MKRDGSGWRRATGGGRASPPWRRSCCSGLGLRVDYAWEGRAPVFDAVAYGRDRREPRRGRRLHARRRRRPSRRATTRPGLPLFVAGLYKLSGGVHERLARIVLALLGALSVLFTYLIGRRLSGPAAGPDRRRRGRDLPGPARVPGDADGGAARGDPALRRGAGDALGGGSTQERACARWLLPGALLGATGDGPARSTSAVAFLLGARRLRSRGLATDWRRSLAQAAILLAGVVARRRPLDDPQRGRPRPLRPDLDRRRPGALRRHLPALRTATRKRSEKRSSTRHPGALRSADATSQRLRPRADPRRARRPALSRPGKRQGPVAHGPRTALGRHHRRAARIRGLRRHQDRRGSGPTARAT